MEHRARRPHSSRLAGAALGSTLAGLVFAILFYALGSQAQDLSRETPADFTVAFIGDQGSGSDAEAVLALILDEGADAVVHQGDFDYNDDPAGWEAQIDAVLGPDFPYFASVGNHDEAAFYGSGGYQDVLVRRMERLGIPWTGDLGVESYFHYQGVFIVLTAPDIFGDGDEVYAPFIRDALASDDSIWSISSWHKNMADMQVGGKSDATGWGVYEESRRGGAIIATGHEHSYSRTHLLSSMEHQNVASTEEPLRLQVDDPSTPEDEGRSFAFVSGLGGASVRDQERDGDWWASVYTSTQNATHGALFGVFNFGGDPHLAYFYFKDIDGNVVDEFLVESAAGLDAAPPAEGPPAFACSDGVDNDGDGLVDFPDDLGCDDFSDDSEDSEAAQPEEPAPPEEPTEPEQPEEGGVLPPQLDDPEPAPTTSSSSRKERRLERRLARIERKMERLGARRARLEDKLTLLESGSEPRKGEIRRTSKRLARTESKLSELEEKRSDLEAQLASISR